MNIKKTLFTVLLAGGCFLASAQEEVKTEYTFQPHWYVMGQFGGQYTLGEIDFGKLISPTAQIGVGYDFSKYWGVRLTVGGWQSKGGSEINFSYSPKDYEKTFKWKYKYIAPTVDLTLNVSNLIAGFNPERLVNVSLFAGLGANFAFDNDEACDALQDMNAEIKKNYTTLKPTDAEYLRYYWDDKRTSLVGNFGVDVDFRINDRWTFNIEFANNVLSDHYNSKKADNADWYFNLLGGVKYSLGKGYTKKTVRTDCDPQIIEKVVERIVEKHDTVDLHKREAIRRDIFFTIRSSKISKAEMTKVQDIANYMNKYPESNVTITGYADRGTGNPRINVGYARNRANMVADVLEKQFGIARSRMTVDSKGDTEQPYAENILNRVSIVIAE